MTLAPPDVDYLCGVVSRRSGNVIAPEQSYLLEARLGSLAQSEGLPSVKELVAELRAAQHSPLHDRVAEAMTINETSFFRDMHPFDAMRDFIFPELIEKRSQSRQLTIWSAACSSGQEPYTMAMLLREHFPQFNDWRVRILATDYSKDILAQAKAGRYNQFEVNRGLPARLLVEYFEPDGRNWGVKQDLRNMIDFKQMNLATPWPFVPNCDIVLLRNVMVYFDSAAKESILRRVREILRPDGCLFLGGGETLINLNVPFEKENVGNTVCYRPTP